MRSLIFATTILVLTHGAAAAAQWDGFYVGAQVGYLWGMSDHSYSNGGPSDSSDPEGFVGGVHVGYNFQFNNTVVGVEGDIEWSGADGSFDNFTGITSSGSADINWLGSLRGRLGFATNDLLPYVTAGAAFARYDFRGGPAGFPCCGYSDTRIGWTVGGGLEYAISPQYSARVEYRYADFGQASGALDPTFPTVTMPVDNTGHALRIGFSYHF